MGTVLLLGHSSDACCRLVRERLLGRGRRVLFLPEDQVLPGLGFAWEVQGRTLRGVLRFDETEVEFGEIDAVLARFFGVPVSPEAYGTTDGRYVSSEWNALAVAWTSGLACPVVNRLRPELWYRVSLNAPALAALAPGGPFRRPRVLVTTREAEARDFQGRCGGRVRYEPLTHPVGYRVDGREGLGKLAALSGTLPFSLTELVEGERFEAFVVGDRVVLAAADGSPAGEPPGPVAGDALALAGALGLTFCRLALVRAPGGGWFCLSLERLPQLDDCGGDVQDLVVGHLADLLDRGASGGPGR